MICGINKVDDLGQPIPTQGSVDFTQYSEVPCLTALPRSDMVPLEFGIPASDAAIDLRDIHLEIGFKVVKADGSNINEYVAPVNQILYSMFRSVDFFISNQRISLNQLGFPFIAYLQTLFYTSQNRKDTIAKESGWIRDTADAFDKLPKKNAKGQYEIVNRGYFDRYSYILKSHRWLLYGPVILDTVLIPRVLPTMTEVSFIFHRADNSFCLQAEKEDYKINIVSAKMLVSKMDLTPHALNHQNRLLNSSGISYPCLTYEMRTIGIPKAAQNVDVVLFNGLLPQRIFLFHVLQKSFTGDFKTNPFNFTMFNLKSIQLLLNGSIDTHKPTKYRRK